MTLVKLFNNALKEIPTVLENLIMMKGWSKERSQQAISIIQQIKRRHMIEMESCLPYSYVKLSQLTITLFPSECGIDNATFGPENIRQGDKYIEDLVVDINRISADIRFSFDGHDYEDDVCTFSIRWEF